MESPETTLTAKDFMLTAEWDPKKIAASKVGFVIFSLGNGVIVAPNIAAIDAIAPTVTIIEMPSDASAVAAQA